MWTPTAQNRASRTPSVHSIASTYSNTQRKSLITSLEQKESKRYDSDQASDATLEDDRVSSIGIDSSIPLMWQAGVEHPAPVMSLISQKLGTDVVDVADIVATPTADKPHHDDDSASQASTMDGQEEFVQPERFAKSLATVQVTSLPLEPESPAPAPYVPGPLESQLAALMSKIVYIEQKQPTLSIQRDEWQEMQARLKALEEEKKTWAKRHEALWALRDEDVENNIKLRGLLAQTRRELEATQKLREEDLSNVSIVRGKLAQKTRELEQVQAQSSRSTSPRRNTRPTSYIQRIDTTDLFTAAKIAALEQRTLELEKANSDLMTELDSSKKGSNVEELNRQTAHKAWKDTVADLESKLKAKDAEISRARAAGGSSTTTTAAPASHGVEWHKIEALLEEHANYRESVGGKLQALRSEKETLQRDLHRKENDCQAMELKVQNLQRRVHLL